MPHRPEPGISGAEFMTRLRILTADADWLEDLADVRAAADRDYWR
ncbi:hypothetical protein [Microbacterium lacticum]|nr:hypothetical protein [Microbacterium lacticum]